MITVQKTGFAVTWPDIVEGLSFKLPRATVGFVSPKNIAFIYIGMGEKDKALEWHKKTYEKNEAGLQFIKVDPMIDILRSDSRFQDILDQMNFSDY